ncbi:hypothetical protein MPH_02128 [Macrophomina phaseolina MS6]|uniref:Uncharacterized protein n=1 Tax=Macrophomina phaseolina (strain MS6) TaxID=1126212 RepID=K2RDL5_MACPH|nr:hypothetical protein MPH_02128 [Macrophomina phaseolina MS6]
MPAGINTDSSDNSFTQHLPDFNEAGYHPLDRQNAIGHSHYPIHSQGDALDLLWGDLNMNTASPSFPFEYSSQFISMPEYGTGYLNLEHDGIAHDLAQHNDSPALPHEDPGALSRIFPGLEPDAVQQAEAALRRWQRSWESAKDASLNPASPSGPLSFNCIAHIRLHADIGPHRVLGWSAVQGLANLECAVFLSKWLNCMGTKTAEGQVSNAEEVKLLGLVESILQEAELGEMGAQERLVARRYKRMAAAVARLCAQTFRGRTSSS